MPGIYDSQKKKCRAQGPQPEKCKPQHLQSHVGRIDFNNSSHFFPVLAFVAVTMIAISLKNISFMAAVPESFRPLLGQPPAPNMTSMALAAYFISSVVVSCHGIFTGTKPGSPLVHLALRSVFYFLYFCADALGENLIAVFVAGLILSAFEHLRARAYHLRMQAGGSPEGRS